jgi:hypothetical protein
LPQTTQKLPAGQKPFFSSDASSYILLPRSLPPSLGRRSLNFKTPKTALQKRFSIHFVSLGKMKRK